MANTDHDFEDDHGGARYPDSKYTFQSGRFIHKNSGVCGAGPIESKYRRHVSLGGRMLDRASTGKVELSRAGDKPGHDGF